MNSKHVILIGVDALSPDGIEKSKTPNLDFLIKNGSYSSQTRAILPTRSAVNWSAVLSGATTAQTGILSNDWQRQEAVLPPVVESSDGLFPTIFRVLRDKHPKSNIAAIYQWGGIEKLIEKSQISFFVQGKHDQNTTDKACNYIVKHKPKFLFVHLDAVDKAGHSHGHGSNKYYQSVEKVDNLIGEMIAASRKSETFSTTTFVIIADHGGRGHNHGGSSLAEITIPFIVSGPDSKKNYQPDYPIYIFDVAPTVAFVLGAPTPFEWVGKPIKSLFTGRSEPRYVTRLPLKSPQIYPSKLVHFQDFLTVELKTKKSHKTYYTLDGSDPTQKSILYSNSFKLSKDTLVKAISVDQTRNRKSLVSKKQFYLFGSKSKPMVVVKYFELSRNHYPENLDVLKPVKTLFTWDFSLENLEQSRQHRYALQMQSKIVIEKYGRYDFYLESDAGSRLFVDGKKILDQRGMRGVAQIHESLNLEPGDHDIKIEYFKSRGGEVLTLDIKGPSFAKKRLSSRLLRI